jgi:hypothetical protein
MNSVKNQIRRRDGLKLGLAGLTVSPWGAPFTQELRRRRK